VGNASNGLSSDQQAEIARRDRQASRASSPVVGAGEVRLDVGTVALMPRQLRARLPIQQRAAIGTIVYGGVLYAVYVTSVCVTTEGAR
jgi:hypothetical protein